MDSELMSDAFLSKFSITLILGCFVPSSFPFYHRNLRKAVWLASIKSLAPFSMPAVAAWRSQLTSCFSVVASPYVEKKQKAANGKATMTDANTKGISVLLICLKFVLKIPEVAVCMPEIWLSSLIRHIRQPRLDPRRIFASNGVYLLLMICY